MNKHQSKNYHSSDPASHQWPCVDWFASLIARFMGPTWVLSGADRTQVGPMVATWTLLSGVECLFKYADWSIEMNAWSSRYWMTCLLTLAFCHFGNMTNGRYGPEIIFIINFTLILINRCYPGLFFLPFSRDELTTDSSVFDITGRANLNIITSISKISFPCLLTNVLKFKCKTTPGTLPYNASGFILNSLLVILMKCLSKRSRQISELTGFDLALFETSFFISDHMFFSDHY